MHKHVNKIKCIFYEKEIKKKKTIEVRTIIVL